MEQIKKCIKEASSILVCGHKNPDGDSLGALLALGLGLKGMGKDVIMLCSDEIPLRFKHLPGVGEVVSFTNRRVDLAVAVDCGSREMLGTQLYAFERAEKVLEIDHHLVRSSFAPLSLVDASASSAGELVYFLLRALGITINKDIAQNIFTSIMVESNSFRLVGLSAQTFEVCSELLRTGLKYSSVWEPLYRSVSREVELLSALCISRCCFVSDGKLAYSTITYGDLKKVGACESDADPLAERLSSLYGVSLAILFREKENKKELRVSMRSKNGINAALLAAAFGGGGHSGAAGCTIPNNKHKKLELLCAARTLIKNAAERGFKPFTDSKSKHSGDNHLYNAEIIMQTVFIEAQANAEVV
jgi:phosphoesterase RecJ-like protein